ncbi:MAG: type II toxin-antitoxin system ParD family antitoxin [Caulobacteraceae bacterium]|nr:type II toxin-antitoxin system ParD family antitoxin [Caulobacteraceae bacterium]
MVDLLDKLDVTEVRVPSDLAAFAKAGVEEGRYRDLDEALEIGLRLLRHRETQIREFQQSLKDAEEEGDREGWLSAQDVLKRLDEIIDSPPE